MPEFRPIATAHLSAVERPGCPNCVQQRMLLSKLGSGSDGSASRTFECQKCGHTRTAVIATDPMNSNVLGWFAGDLRRPT